ncbi:MAG: hypothetical protein H6865_00345 [Rhodospirillales bacterium]|nr:hypothetical protein [Alphaproteobacteria bacterium]MCB9986075.1 hypothetical protein [Rhodospirillales bacterium]USO07358.1 MAG: hypothetical protein H6866_08030 [Rhodospirillales bacterium]
MEIRRFFIDAEFNDEIGDCRIEPISLALVPDDDAAREFYAVSSEFSEGAAHGWLRMHVLPKLPPRGERLTLAEIRDDISTYFNACAPINGQDAKLEFWGKNIGMDMAVLGLIFGGLSKFYAAVGACGFKRSYFNDSDMLRTRLYEQGVKPPFSHIPDAERHMALLDARQERAEYRMMKALLG